MKKTQHLFFFMNYKAKLHIIVKGIFDAFILQKKNVFSPKKYSTENMPSGLHVFQFSIYNLILWKTYLFKFIKKYIRIALAKSISLWKTFLSVCTSFMNHTIIYFTLTKKTIRAVIWKQKAYLIMEWGLTWPQTLRLKPRGGRPRNKITNP